MLNARLSNEMATIMSGRAANAAALRVAGLTREAGPGARAIVEMYVADIVPDELSAGLWLLADTEAAKLMIGEPIMQAVLHLSILLDMPHPAVLIDAREGDVPFSFCEHMRDGAAYIRFNTTAPDANLIRHELAHAFLRSTNRVLDEGLADWASLGVTGVEPMAHAELIRKALMMTSPWDLQFERTAPEHAERRALRKSAARLIESLVLRSGPAALQALFAEISGAARPAHLTLIETALGCKIADWRDRMEAAGNRLSAILRDGVLARLSARHERVRQSAELACRHADAHPGAGALDAALTMMASEMRGRLAVDETIAPEDIKRFDRLIARAGKLGLGAPRRMVLKAHRLLLDAALADRAGASGRVIMTSLQAEQILRMHLESAPDDLDAHLLLGRLLVYKPVQMGGGEVAAEKQFAYVRRAMDLKEDTAEAALNKACN